MKKYILFILLSVCLWSCSEDEIKPYHGGQYLYFSHLMNSNEKAVSVSFNNYLFKDELIVKIRISLVGDPVKEATPYKVIVVDTATTAKSKNYQLPELSYFKPGLASDTLEVKLIKTDDLKEDVKLCLQIVPNEYFDGTVKQYEQIRIIFNNVISKPVWWTSDVVKFYLGKYSRTKYEALIEYTGVSDFGSLNSGAKRQCALKLKDAIEKYNLMDKDDNGDEFPMEVPIY